MSAILCRMIFYRCFSKLADGIPLDDDDYLYLVAWVDWEIKCSTWQYWGDLIDCQDAKDEFFARLETRRPLTLEELTAIRGYAERIESKYIGKTAEII